MSRPDQFLSLSIDLSVSLFYSFNFSFFFCPLIESFAYYILPNENIQCRMGHSSDTWQEKLWYCKEDPKYYHTKTLHNVERAVFEETFKPFLVPGHTEEGWECSFVVKVGLSVFLSCFLSFLNTRSLFVPSFFLFLFVQIPFETFIQFLILHADTLSFSLSLSFSRDIAE